MDDNFKMKKITNIQPMKVYIYSKGTGKITL